MSGATNAPCGCWAKVALHEGHCCFADYPIHAPLGTPVLCGHDEAGMEMHRQAGATT